MMLFLALAAAAVMFWAHRVASRLDDRAIRRSLALFAIAVVVEALVIHLGAAVSGLRPMVIPIAAAAGMAIWVAISGLVTFETRRRDWIPRVVLLGLAGALLVSGVWLGAGLVAATATLRYQWRVRFRTARLFQLGLGALVL